VARPLGPKGGGGGRGWAGRDGPWRGREGGKGGAAGPPSWADAKGDGAAGPKGEKGGERKRKGFPFLYLFFYMNAFTLSNNQKMHGSA
jgi:hypothetical protein